MSSPGLRERKRQKTRWSIQQHALRLFQEQGYDQTTVEQIAAAAEVSPSTFFRYFRTKEDVVVEDEYDPLLAELFVAAPRDMSVLAALRHAIRTALTGLDEAERAKMIQRAELMWSVPALRMRQIDNMVSTLDVLVDAIAERTGRPSDDLGVRTFAGSCIGAMIAATLAWFGGERTEDLSTLLDRALAELEKGVD